MNKVVKSLIKKRDSEAIIKFALEQKSKNCVRKIIKFLRNEPIEERDIKKLELHLSSLMSSSKRRKTNQPIIKRGGKK